MKKLFFIVAALFIARNCHAQIVFSTTSHAVGFTASLTSATLTTTAGANSALVAIMVSRDGGTHSSVKWNTSQSFTKLIEKDCTNGLQASIWCLANPAVVTSSVVFNTSGQTWVAGSVDLLFGVDQTCAFDVTASSEVSSASTIGLTGLITTTTNGDAIIDGVSSNNNGSAFTMQAETNRSQKNNYQLTGARVVADSVLLRTPPGTAVMGWNIFSGINACEAAAAIRPATVSTLAIQGGHLNIQGGHLITQ